jgi:5'-nucleotidase
LSDNVAVTLDPSRAPGDRVTSVRVDGEPLVADRTYTIGTVSFLATGGDNFRAFAQGKGTDTGLVDRDAWISYLEKHKPLAPEFDRRQVYATGLPGSIGAGDTVSFTLNRLNLTSLGSPENRTVDVVLKTGNATTPVVGSPFPVTGGSATIAFTAPATIPAGSTFVATARPSGTTVTIPATETQVPAADTTTVATVSPSKVVVRSTRPTITATVRAGDTPVDGGTVNFYVDGRNVGSVLVKDGSASVQLPAFAQPGSKHVSVEYTGVPGTTNDSADALTIDVVKATPVMAVTVQPDTIRKGKTRPQVSVTLTAPGQVVSGYVAVRSGGSVVGLDPLSDGRATVVLPTYKSKGQQTVTVQYLGSDLAEAVSRSVTFTVTN